MAQSDEEKRRLSWLEVQNQLAPGEDPIERMLSDMAWAGVKGWHRVRTANGGSAVFPETATDEDAWEQRCQEMHDQQVPCELPDRPVERSRMRGKYAVAAFEMQYADAPIQNFADTPAATGNHTTVKRSN